MSQYLYIIYIIISISKEHMGVVQNRWPTNAPIFSRRLHEHRTATADSNRPSCLSDGWTRAAAAGTNFWGQFFWLEKNMGIKYGKKK